MWWWALRSHSAKELNNNNNNTTTTTTRIPPADMGTQERPSSEEMTDVEEGRTENNNNNNNSVSPPPRARLSLPGAFAIAGPNNRPTGDKDENEELENEDDDAHTRDDDDAAFVDGEDTTLREPIVAHLAPQQEDDYDDEEQEKRMDARIASHVEYQVSKKVEEVLRQHRELSFVRPPPTGPEQAGTSQILVVADPIIEEKPSGCLSVGKQKWILLICILVFLGIGGGIAYKMLMGDEGGVVPVPPLTNSTLNISESKPATKTESPTAVPSLPPPTLSPTTVSPTLSPTMAPSSATMTPTESPSTSPPTAVPTEDSNWFDQIKDVVTPGDRRRRI